MPDTAPHTRALAWMAAGTAAFLLLLAAMLVASWFLLAKYGEQGDTMSAAASVRTHSERVAALSLALHDVNDAERHTVLRESLLKAVAQMDRVQGAMVNGLRYVDEHGHHITVEPIGHQANARAALAGWQRWRSELAPLLARDEPAAVLRARDAALAFEQPMLELLTRQEAAVEEELSSNLERFRHLQIGGIATLGLVFGVLAFANLAYLRRVQRHAHVDAREMRAARQRAEQASQAKTQFLARMSHELRTPLNAVLGLSQLLRTRWRAADAQTVSYLAAIEDSGRHLLALIDDTLDLARIEAGQMKVQRSAVRLAPLAAAVRMACESQAREAGVVIELDNPACDDTLTVQGDAVRVRQILLNLVSNAIKYNRPGGRAAIGVTADAKTVRISVADNGPGLAPTQRAALFQPYNRLGAERGKVPGTGIGLSIAKRLAQMMNGDIEVESEPGRGSLFTLRLQRAEDAALASDSQSAALDAPAAQQRPATLLYVEDNEVNIVVFEACLAHRPRIRVLVARDADQALELARTQPLDLAVLDLNLPGTNGFELHRMLRTMPQHLRLRTALLTADAMPDTARQARQAGIERVWTKPIEPGPLLAEIDALLAA